MSKIVVGMSGGVDSAVVAQILKNQGHQVIGVFMRNWDSALNNDFLGNPHQAASVCPEERDWQDVVKLGEQIGIEVKRVDFVNEYWNDVFRNLISEYQAGRTPNPDLLCNRYVKFGAFYEWVFKNIPQVDFIATGHYANWHDKQLQKPLDLWKDQTYFLAQVPKKRFSKVLFPLANLKKAQVRVIAQKHNLLVAQKKDSTGICFIGERDFQKFLQNYIPAQPGKIINILNQEVVGDHVGAMYYTIGQRKGLNLGGMSEPFYVAGHNMLKKEIYVAPASHPEFLISYRAHINNVNWLSPKKAHHTSLQVKFRYKSKPVDCQIKWLSEHELEVIYPSGFTAVTPGQQAVFYDQNVCLGGGVITKVFDHQCQKTYL